MAALVNPLGKLDLTLADLCNISNVRGPKEIRPEHTPLLTEVESVVERNFKTNTSKTVSRYGLVLPGSNFMRVLIKVDEEKPSVSKEIIDKCGGMIRVSIEGFTYGVIEENGTARPYMKATRIVPIQTQTQRG